MRFLVVLLTLCGIPALAQAGKFGGFSADGTRYLDGKKAVCAPAAVDANGKPLASPTCVDEDAATLKGRKFAGPARLKPVKVVGAVGLDVRWDGTALEINGDSGSGAQPLVVWEAPAAIQSVRGPWLSGTTLVVELVTGKTSAITVGFDVAAPLTAVSPKPGGLADRLSKRGTTWTQRLIPCEQAGVTFVLKDRKASITIESKCGRERDKLRVSGAYKLEEPDRLTVRFENQDGPDEDLTCKVSGCDDNASLDCIRCDSEDVSFVAKPAL